MVYIYNLEIENKNTIQIKENNKDFDNNDNSDYEGEFINDKKNENEKENEKKEDNKYNNEIKENVIKKDIKKDNSINILNSNKEKKYVEDESELKISRLSDMEHYSYLNAILVCLGNIEQLKKYFLDRNIRDGNCAFISFISLNFIVFNKLSSILSLFLL